MANKQETLQNRFEAAVKFLQNLPRDSNSPVSISNEQKLTFYALYKQATIGPCNIPQPSLYKITERYKWAAWNSLGSISKEEAMEKYLRTLETVASQFPPSPQRDQLLQNLREPENTNPNQMILRSSFSNEFGGIPQEEQEYQDSAPSFKLAVDSEGEKHLSKSFSHMELKVSEKVKLELVSDEKEWIVDLKDIQQRMTKLHQDMQQSSEHLLRIEKRMEEPRSETEIQKVRLRSLSFSTMSFLLLWPFAVNALLENISW
jgi:acyl-CoA-binding protein